MSQRMRRLVVCSFLFMLLILTQHAWAQSQPKGPAFIVFSAINQAAGLQTSGVYGWSAFEAVQLIATASAACDFTVVTQDCATKDGTFITANDNPVFVSLSLTGATGSTAWPVGNLKPYVKFTLQVTSAACTVTLVAVPYLHSIGPAIGTLADGTAFVATAKSQPVQTGGFAIQSTYPARAFRFDDGAQSSVLTKEGGPTAVSTESVAAVTDVASNVIAAAAATASRSKVLLANQGTNTAICRLGTAASITAYSFVLAAGTAVRAGNGGTAVLDGWRGLVSCICEAGLTTTVVVSAW